ncbi:hypothetical protein [Thermodesulfobacterium thermophilum]|uniref:hypothetical protein n=1 Tax=Thermodesulfobacterium thermophilum TaxID=886 RepID=UPI0003B5B546|nr:hypothetical protein [Thermodesulfobacterium thermophilum]
MVAAIEYVRLLKQYGRAWLQQKGMRFYDLLLDLEDQLYEELEFFAKSIYARIKMKTEKFVAWLKKFDPELGRMFELTFRRTVVYKFVWIVPPRRVHTLPGRAWFTVLKEFLETRQKRVKKRSIQRMVRVGGLIV